MSVFEVLPRNGSWHPDPRGEAGWRWFDDDQGDWTRFTQPGLAERAAAGASVNAGVAAAVTFTVLFGLGLVVASWASSLASVAAFVVAGVSAVVATRAASSVGAGVFFQSLGQLVSGLPEEPDRPPVRVSRGVYVAAGVVAVVLYVAVLLLMLAVSRR